MNGSPKERHISPEGDLCIHGNFNNSCKQCQAERNKQPDITEPKGVFKTFFNTPLGRKVRTGIVWGLTTAAAAGVFESARSVIAYREKINDTADGRFIPDAEKQKFVIDKEYVESHISPDAIRGIATSVVLQERSTPEGSPGLNVDKNVGIEPETFKALFKEGAGYPKGWLSGSVSSIDIHADPNYKLSFGSDFTTGGVTNAENNLSQPIEINIGSVSGFQNDVEKVGAVDNIFSHEILHRNDWQTAHGPSMSERLATLTAFHKRIVQDSAEGRPSLIPEYLENYSNPSVDRQTLELKEAWAELGMLCLQRPEWMQNNMPEHYQIMRNWMTLSDPSFNPAEAAEYRDGIIQTTESETTQ